MTQESRQVRRARARAEAKALKKQQRMTEPVLTAFYWGYKADQPEGFEITNMTFQKLGMEFGETQKIGQLIKDAVDQDLKIYKEMPASDRKDYIAQQWHNLQAAMEKAKQMPQTIGEVMPAVIMFACAVSTLVAAGEIEQSEYSGDKFGHVQMDKGLWAAMNKHKESA